MMNRKDKQSGQILHRLFAAALRGRMPQEAVTLAAALALIQMLTVALVLVKAGH